MQLPPRLGSLVPHGRWVLLVAVLSVPAGVVGGLASMFTMVFWDAGLVSPRSGLPRLSATGRGAAAGAACSG